MKLLVIGGTRFLGRHLVEAALARGDQVALFHRGRGGPEPFPEAEHVHDDRDGKLGVLKGRRWDAVVDTCGYVPRVVRVAARMLAPAASHYTFISSISVYAGFRVPSLDERAALATVADPSGEVVDGETYGGLKALCEEAAEQAMPGRVLNVRAGLIVGPFDPTDRFTYWVRRVARGGEVLVAGRPDRQVQFVDARDLAAWILHMADTRQSGTFNAAGPERALTMRELLDTARRVSGSDAQFVWADEDFLLGRGVAPWSEVPLWIPAREESLRFMQAVSNRKAVATGLTFRPLADTIRDTLAWDATRVPTALLQAGLSAERERGLLHDWHGR
jgi:2'-hydroxyisoflavone reductase